jgi:hypothetical protein
LSADVDDSSKCGVRDSFIARAFGSDAMGFPIRATVAEVRNTIRMNVDLKMGGMLLGVCNISSFSVFDLWQ